MMCRWISVNERLPETGQEVLVLLRGGARTLAKLQDIPLADAKRLWVDRHAVRYAPWCVTHWLPLPAGESTAVPAGCRQRAIAWR